MAMHALACEGEAVVLEDTCQVERKRTEHCDSAFVLARSGCDSPGEVAV